MVFLRSYPGTKIPSKIKKNLWLMVKNSILTKDSLLKRAGRVTIILFFVGKMKILNTCFFTAQLLDLSGTY